jgi:hypothetical protein
MKRKISFFLAQLLIYSLFPAIECVSAQIGDSYRAKSQSLKQFLEKITEAENSIWESKPIEIYAAKIQVLDKISGKVFRWEVKSNESVAWKGIELTIKRCFKNSPEDPKEICAFVEIAENKRKIFSGWLFASSPSANLFAHPVYDVRVEF